MKKVLALVFAFCMITLISEATLIKGSVPNKGEKRFTFNPDFSGTVLLHLIYDNKASDLDLQLGFTDQNGDIQLVAISASTLENFEQLEIGVLGGEEYSIFVVSDHGPSPFRLNFDGTFTTNGAAGAAGKISTIQLKEAPIDAASRKFLDKMKARRVKKQ
jgi:hypothetical protein